MRGGAELRGYLGEPDRSGRALSDGESGAGDAMGGGEPGRSGRRLDSRTCQVSSASPGLWKR